MPSCSRRDFLAASAVALSATAAELTATETSPAANSAFEPVRIPDWVYSVSRMAFLSPGQVDEAAKAGVQVVHSNAVWPYYPLRRDGGGLSDADKKVLRNFVEACHRHGMKLSLGLPPFPSAALVKAHPDWRIHPDDTGSVLKVEPREDNLGTRIGCNLGPWGDYLIDVCAELVEDFGLDGYSFDGNYHPPICFCPACKSAYKTDKNKPIPPRADLNDIAYREYLVWRGERLEDHYRRLQTRLKKLNPDAVVMTWTVNAGRYGHFLHSPRAMPTRLNLLIDLPMQEWWLDETNFGASAAPAFGAAYVRAVTGDRPAASEPYLMSRGNPYGTDSFPKHERLTRALLATTNGCLSPESLGWPGHADSAQTVLREIKAREPWLLRTRRLPWAALLVSEQTRQFYAYRDIASIHLPHLFGAFRCAMEEHLPLSLINDWDLTPHELSKYRVLFLPNSAALSDAQVSAIRQFVQNGGGLVATGETSLCDELGRPRMDFALADLFGVTYRGRPLNPVERPELESNFAIAIDENYWKERTGSALLSWTPHELFADKKLVELVPHNNVRFRGPLVLVTEPKNPSEIAARLTPDGKSQTPSSAIVARSFGSGRVFYLAAALDAALYSYAYPYQRRLLARAIQLAAGGPPAISVEAPMSVQTTFFTQLAGNSRRTLIHLFNATNTTANHGLPAMDVPLREETIPIHGIRIRFTGELPQKLSVEPGHHRPRLVSQKNSLTAELPPLELHSILVAEY